LSPWVTSFSTLAQTSSAPSSQAPSSQALPSSAFEMPKTTPTATIKKPKKLKERSAAAEAAPAAADPQVADEPEHTSDGRVAKQPKVIVVLEGACLETGKVGKDHVLLNCDDHQGFLRKHNRDPAESRPDILHQMMLILLDSPLNKAGLLRLYVRTAKGVLIEVSPQIRIPRTFKRFAGLMVQLLHKLSIRAANGPHKLLKVIKNPIVDHLPPNARITLLSVTGRCATPTRQT
jgi:rRNA small subunit pseudouridine methyltransferase Nep1